MRFSFTALYCRHPMMAVKLRTELVKDEDGQGPLESPFLKACASWVWVKGEGKRCGGQSMGGKRESIIDRHMHFLFPAVLSVSMVSHKNLCTWFILIYLETWLFTFKFISPITFRFLTKFTVTFILLHSLILLYCSGPTKILICIDSCH